MVIRCVNKFSFSNIPTLKLLLAMVNGVAMPSPVKWSNNIVQQDMFHTCNDQMKQLFN